MVNTKNLRDAVKKSADKLAKSATKNVEAVKKATSGKYSNSKNLKDHKHCRECGKMISPSSESLLCNSQVCIDKFEKDLKVKKQLRLWMVILVIVLILPNILTLLGV